MQEYARDQYCSMDALHFLMSIYVTGGISGGATRKLGASEIEIAVRENRSRLRRQESTPRITISPVHLPNPSHHNQIFPGENLVVWKCLFFQISESWPDLEDVCR